MNDNKQTMRLVPEQYKIVVGNGQKYLLLCMLVLFTLFPAAAADDKSQAENPCDDSPNDTCSAPDVHTGCGDKEVFTFTTAAFDIIQQIWLIWLVGKTFNFSTTV